MDNKKLHVFNLEKVHDLLDGFAKLTGLAAAIINLQEEVLLDCGWKPICTDYHRVHPESAKKCIASDAAIKRKMKSEKSYYMQYCKNGLADAAMPLIIEGEHIANVFVGQFLLEPPDVSYFKQQAQEYGFDESSYLQALDEIPIISQEHLNHVMRHLQNMLHSISEEVLQNSRLAELNEALEASEEQHRRLFETMTQGVIYQAADGSIISANPAAEKILGLSFEQMQGKTSMDPRWKMITEDGAPVPGDEHPAMIALRTGETVGPVVRGVFHPENEAYVWLQITAVPLFHPHEDKPFQVYATMDDITERRQIRQKLRESVEKYRSLIEQSVDGIYLHDVNGNILEANYAATEQTGYSREELVHLTVFGLHPESFGVNQQTDAILEQWKSLAVGESITIEAEHQCKNGRVLPVEIRTGKVSFQSKEYILALVSDISERKHAEERLKQVLHEYETVFQGTQDAMFLVEVLGSKIFRYTRNNASHEKYTGIPVSQLKGKTPQDLLGKELGDRVADNYQRCVDAGKPISYEETLDLPGGEKVWNTTLTPVFSDENICYIVGSSKDITELKQAQEEIQRFKTIADNAVYGQAITDLEGTLVYCNQFAAEIHGYTPEEITGSHISMFHTPEQNKIIKHILALLLQKGYSSPEEIWHVHRDGTEFPMLMSSVVLYDGERTPQYIAATGIDIRAYHQLQQNYQLLFTTMQNGVALFETILTPHGMLIDYRFLSVNPAFETMTGLRAEDVIGNTVLEVLPDIEQIWIDTYGKMVLSGEPVRLEYYSDIFEKHFDVTAIQPSKGKVACIFQDITERKLSEKFTRIRLELLEYAHNHSLEQLLQKTLEEAESLTDSSISFYHFVEKDQKTLLLHTWSKNTQEVFDGFEGKSMHSVLDDAGVWADCLREMQPVIHNDYASLAHKKGLPEGHAPIIRELVVPIARGNSIVSILGVGNKPSNYTKSDTEALSHLADITWEIIEHKRSDEQLKEMHAQLTQMQKMEAVGRLAGGIAHDFNNMLGVILGHTELALEQIKSNHTIYGDLLEIRKATERSSGLTAQLLAFARKQTVRPKVIDPNHEIGSMIKMLKRLISEDVKMIWYPGKDVWTIQIDPSQLHQILINLCVNSREAISGTGTITIETQDAVLDAAYCAHHEELISGDYVKLSVSDTGCGIDEAILPYIFEPFFTTREVGKGTGMGLATVYGIVKQNQGCINVYSEVERGTTVNVYLPKYDKKTDQKHTAHLKTEIAQGIGTILLVDDNLEILSMTQKMLERLGYTVFTAETPKKAIQIVETGNYSIDLLITDVVMPEMSGRSLADILQAKHPELKLLYMSGYSNSTIAHQGVLDEGVSYIQKPFSIKELSNTIQKVLES